MSAVSALASIFLYLFAADAAVSTVDDVAAILGAGNPLQGIRNHVAGLAMLGSLLSLLGMVVAPQLPWRPLLASALFPVVATALGTYPVLLAFGLVPGAWLPVDLLQLLVAGDAALAVRRRSGVWWLHGGEGPALSWRHSLRAGFWLGLVFPVLLVSALIGEVVVGVDVATGGYVRITPRGIELTERELFHAGHSVRLVAMMHVGDRDFYEELLGDLAGVDAVVLDEGVKDSGNRLGARVQYSRVAEALGLETQAIFHPAADGLRRRNADLTTDDFAESTVTLLRLIDDVHSGAGDLPAAFAAYEAAASPESLNQLLADVLDNRNAHLLRELDRAVDAGENVVVPWGAAHLWAIEEALLARGWQRRGWRTRVVLAWRLPSEWRLGTPE